MARKERTYFNKLGDKVHETKTPKRTYRSNQSNWNKKGIVHNVDSAGKTNEGRRSIYSSMEFTKDGRGNITIGGVGINDGFGPERGYRIRNGKTLKQAQAQLERLRTAGADRNHPYNFKMAETAVRNMENYHALAPKPSKARTASQSGSTT